MKLPVFCLVAGAVALAGCGSVGTIESKVGRNPSKHDANISFSIHAPSGPGPFPAAILMHGCGGLDWGTERGMARHASHLVDAGFVALILDSFTARGIDSICSSSATMAEARAFRRYDAFHAMRRLRERDDVDRDNVFLVGLSHGGSVAAELAGGGLSPGSVAKRDLTERFPDEPWFRAIVAYYPWCPHVPKRLDTPLLVLSGEKDDWTPSEVCFWRKAVVKGAPYDVAIYENAHHSFDLPIPTQTYLGHTVGGNAEAAAASRRRMVAWFRAHME